MRSFNTLSELLPCVGEEVSVSDWIVIDQDRIDKFAEATGDFNWIHVDAKRSAEGPFGQNIAHGFLTLSLLPMLYQNALRFDNIKLGLNYGLNKVRFPEPVLVNSRLRGRFKLIEMQAVAPMNGHAGYQITFQVTMECEGRGKPACVAESVQRRFG